MAQGIYLIDDADRLVELREQPYDSEDLLQRLLATHPEVLAGDQFHTTQPRRWLLIRRETAIPSAEGGRWSIDHVFVDQDGIPTLVEVKRSTDSRIRREVVGQMLDYAANAVVYWPAEHLRAEFEARCHARGIDADRELSQRLGVDDDPSAFWLKVKTNLKAGRVRLVVVADVVPPELRRIVEFLNEQMDPAEVLALEVRQYVGGAGLRTLVPSIIGKTAEAEQRKGAPEGKQWDEESLFAAAATQRTPEEMKVAARLLEWSKANASRIFWGKGARYGSFIPIVKTGNLDHQIFAAYPTFGTVEILFQYYMAKPPFDDESKRLVLLDRINRIGGITIPVEKITKRPSVKFSQLSLERLEELLGVFDWVVEQIRTPRG